MVCRQSAVQDHTATPLSIYEVHVSHVHKDACFLSSQLNKIQNAQGKPKAKLPWMAGFSLSVPAVREECQASSTAAHE